MRDDSLTESSRCPDHNTRDTDATWGAGIATADRFTVAASEDPGAFTHNAEDTRAFTIGIRGSGLTVYDYEAPSGVTVQYRARALHDYSGVFAFSAWGSASRSWSSNDWWLKHPNNPALNTVVLIRSFPSVTRAGRQAVHHPLGASTISDTRESNRGTVTLRSDSIAAQNALDALIDTRDTLLLQSPPGQGGPDYIRVLNHERSRVVDWANATQVFETLEFVQITSNQEAVVGLLYPSDTDLLYPV